MPNNQAALPATDLLKDQIAVITGASSGIGRAIAVELSHHQAHICAVGRNTGALAATVTEAQRYSQAQPFQTDLADEESLYTLARSLSSQFSRIDILVHSAGLFEQGRMPDARIGDLDSLYTVNVRAPYLLTQQLLPLLKASHGQIVFINSSVGLTARRPEIGQYAATKHALKALADSLREEVNPEGVRVLTVYPGRTATRQQQAVHHLEQRPYRPELLLQPEDVASIVVHSLLLPRTAEVTDISIRPMLDTSSKR